MKFLQSAILLLITIFVASCNSYEISMDYVTEKINYLASDELKGRQTFSKEIDKAADYIANDFNLAGLQEFENNTGFKQNFSLYEIGIDKSELIINGNIIDPATYVAQLDEQSVNWNNNKDVIITYVTADEDFAEAFGRIRRNDDNLLIIVDPMHTEAFSRYSRYFSRPARKSELGEGRSLVMALSDVATVNDYSFSASAKLEEKQLTNVVGWIPGNRTDEFVLFSAHYDHIGIRRPNDAGDSIANGANDDASGTVAVMALANYFASKGKPERSILFTAFTAEESGGYGSKYFSKQLDPDQIVAMFNIEMIGKPAVSGPNTAWITGWNNSDFGPLLQASAEGSGYEFYADPYPDQNLFYRSDNATLARLGVPAHSISTTPIDVDADYHQVTDEVETLDLEHLTNTIKAIVIGAEQIISGEQTPTRVNPEAI